MTINKHIFGILLLLFGMVLPSCQSELDPQVPTGGLQVVLGNISPSVTSRSTPADIGTPATEYFRLQVTDAAGNVKYDGKFTEDVIHLVQGRYTVNVTCGENPIIGPDAPYYVGSQVVQVADEKVTTADVRCTVGNALVSAVFGEDETQRARFDKFFSDYSLDVTVDNYTMSITRHLSFLSAYFRAGSHATLRFSATLRADGRQVSQDLDLSEQPDFPAVFRAADHAVVTLSLGDPESTSVVSISKVELEEATIEGTIPLSWLPVPTATAAHQYDASGNLVGTDILFSSTYPGKKWTAIVKDAQGLVCRTVEGVGPLRSDYRSDSELPYLPAGDYTATYYVEDEGRMEEISVRNFTVGNPDLHLNLQGYTSYTKYLEGQIDAANDCDAYTIYAPGASINVSSALLANSRYESSMSTTFDGAPLLGTKTANGVTAPNMTGRPPKFEPYTLAATATFDKVNLTASRDFFITGLPVSFAPPTKQAGWSVAANKVTWNDDNVQLGQMAGAGAHAISYSSFAIPAGTVVDCPYIVRMHGATVGTTLSLTLGGYTYFKETSSSGVFNSQFHDYDSHAVFTTTENVTSSKANSSYGSGQTYSVIYSLSYKYGKQ